MIGMSCDLCKLVEALRIHVRMHRSTYEHLLLSESDRSKRSCVTISEGSTSPRDVFLEPGFRDNKTSKRDFQLGQIYVIGIQCYAFHDPAATKGDSDALIVVVKDIQGMRNITQTL
jgi:hypothetical protein